MELLNIDLDHLIYTVGVLMGCGIVGGFLAGLLGVGGGIIFVPALCFVFISIFHVDPNIAIVIATATSLTCMIPTSISAAWSQYKRGNTDLNIIKTWSVAMFIGVCMGALISNFYGGQWLGILFGVVMILNSVNTLLRAQAKPMFDHLPSGAVQHVIAFCIAFFSVMLGIGGGTLTVPVLNACSEPPHRSVGTSSAVSLFVCIPGVLVLLGATIIHNNTPPEAPLGNYGFINFLAALCIIPCSVLCAPLGVRVGKTLSPTNLKRLFALFLLLVAIKMFHQSLQYYGFI